MRELTKTSRFINHPSFSRFKRQLSSHLPLLRLSALLGSLTLLISLYLLLRQPISQFVAFTQQFSSSSLTNSQGVTNFVILGVGGKNHAGTDLTDTLIFVSVNTLTSRIAVITIPRDIWVPSLRAKINTAYHYGHDKAGPAGGLLLAKSAVSEIINQPVDYAVLLDFSTFESAIDLVGGIDVVVERTFDDYLYPVAGKENDLCDGDPQYRCRYEHLHFSSGPQHMDGATALKYVRSRYSTDDIEGTDFGRSRRQELVINAFIKRLLSPSVTRHPQTYLDLYQLFSQSVITDLQPAQYYALVKIAYPLRHTSPRFASLSQPDQLYHPAISARQDYQWVLLPRDDNPQIIYDYVTSLLHTP